MPRFPSAYKGPAIVLAIGGSFAMLGAIPLSITMALGVKTSATIIGLGLVGFGMLLIIPGLGWCFIVMFQSHRHWRERRRQRLESAPVLGDISQQNESTRLHMESTAE